jgi:multiple sugar transport system ATP-binding protein
MGRAIVRDPKVFLFDEPLSNLDAKLRVQMRTEIKKVHQTVRTTTIYVTHDQVEAMSLADRISVMNGGHIVQAASPVEVYRNPAARFVGSFIGNPPMNFLPARRNGDGRYHVAGIALDGPSTGGAELEFAVRPEDLTVAPGGLKATARVIEPLGAHTLVTTEVDGALFRAVLESDIRVAPGDELSLVPRPDRVRWFDPETSRAVH